MFPKLNQPSLSQLIQNRLPIIRPRTEVEAARQEIAAAVAEAISQLYLSKPYNQCWPVTAAAKPAAGGAPVSNRTIRVDIERLDSL